MAEITKEVFGMKSTPATQLGASKAGCFQGSTHGKSRRCFLTASRTGVLSRFSVGRQKRLGQSPPVEYGEKLAAQS
jgi:hypothetical protein